MQQTRLTSVTGIFAVVVSALLAALVPGAAASAGAANLSPSRSTAQATETTPVSDASRQTLRQRLEAIPGMHVHRVEHPSDRATFFLLSYRQPVDHRHPQGATFRQRLSILHVGMHRPTVISTSGYNLFPFPYAAEPTRLLRGNQVETEQRYFAPSIPKRPDWSKMTIWQAAADHHRLIKALKPIYDGPWFSTGASKGGMTATYHRRFFPHDVVGTVAYVAPNDVRNFKDRYLPFINHAGEDPACNRALRVVQRQALMRRDTLVPMVRQENRREGHTVRRTLGSWDKSFEATVEDTPFQFWQYYDASFCDEIPAADATDREIFDFFKTFYGWTFNSDQGSGPFKTYFYQASLQLGWPEEAKGAWWLEGLLHYRLAYSAPNLTPRAIRPHHFHGRAMLDVDRWVRHHAQRMLFVYGENDPWSAEPFRVRRGAVDSHVYWAPNGNHGASIAALRPGQRDRAQDTLRRWAGLPPLTSRAARFDDQTYAGVRTEESLRTMPGFRD